MLDKKQGPVTVSSQSGSSGSSTPGKGNSYTGVDEPGVTYQAGNDKNITSPEKTGNGTDEFSNEGSSGNGQITGVDEDDLPF